MTTFFSAASKDRTFHAKDSDTWLSFVSLQRESGHISKVLTAQIKALLLSWSEQPEILSGGIFITVHQSCLRTREVVAACAGGLWNVYGQMHTSGFCDFLTEEFKLLS
jgi:hypothetical protein